MRKKYYKSAFVAVFLGVSTTLFSQSGNISINLSGNASNNPAILDLSDASNANLGFLLPNVSLASSTDILTIPAPTTGLIVWNTNATMPNGAGFYYWSGGQWNYLYNSGSPVGNFIINGTTPQVGANFNIELNGVIGGTLNVTGLSTLGAITTVGIASINASGAGTTTIGNGTNALVENGNASINESNGAATTNIATGNTTGAVTIGNNSVTTLTATAALVNINASTGNNEVTNIGTGTTIGSTTIGGGTGNQVVNINNGGAGTTSIGNAGTGSVVIGNSTGKTGINTATPKNVLDVNGAMAVGSYAGTNVAPANGVIISGQVGIGNNAPASSAVLDLRNTSNKAFLPPQNANPNANITVPVLGEIVFNTTDGCYQWYNGTAFVYAFGPGTAVPVAYTLTGPSVSCGAGLLSYTITTPQAGVIYLWTASGSGVSGSPVTGSGTAFSFTALASGVVNVTCMAYTSCNLTGVAVSNPVSFTIGADNVQLDNSAVAACGGTTLSITTSGTNELVLVFANGANGAGPSWTGGSVSYSGASSGSATLYTTKLGNALVEDVVLYFVAPVAGTYNIVVTEPAGYASPRYMNFALALKGFSCPPSAANLSNSSAASTLNTYTCNLSAPALTTTTANSYVVGDFTENTNGFSTTMSWTNVTGLQTMYLSSCTATYNSGIAGLAVPVSGTIVTARANDNNCLDYNSAIIAILVK